MIIRFSVVFRVEMRSAELWLDSLLELPSERGHPIHIWDYDMLLLVGNSLRKRSLEFEDGFAKPQQDKSTG